MLRASLIATRKASGLTQADLAKRLKCHQSFVARLESGQRRIDVVELIVIAREIGFNLTELIDSVEQATDKDHRI